MSAVGALPLYEKPTVTKEILSEYDLLELYGLGFVIEKINIKSRSHMLSNRWHESSGYGNKQWSSLFVSSEYREKQDLLKREVHGLLEEAGTENWDGEDALALTLKTVEIAQKLIDKFPLYVDKPDVSVTPHGEVDFDWVVDKDVMFTISVSPKRDIAFAGLFGKTQIHGCEPWAGVLPEFVDCCFERLYKAQTA